MHHIDLADIHLDTGSHSEEGKGCVMNWVARFAGEPVTDHPVCTSPVLTKFAISWNDALPDDTRQRLVPFIPRLVGTAGDPAAEEVRAWMATDWLVRTLTVTWLRTAGLTARADELAALPQLTSSELASAAQPIIEAAKKEAYAVRDAAGGVGDAARAAARDAARAAWAAAGAAGAAAWDAGAAARDAARAARDAARAAWAAAGAARDAARAAGAAAWDAGAAAWAAAWDAGAAAWDAGAAAWDAARAAADETQGSYAQKYNAAYKAARPLLDEAFRETTAELTESAFALFDRMIDVRTAVPA